MSSKNQRSERFHAVLRDFVAWEKRRVGCESMQSSDKRLLVSAALTPGILGAQFGDEHACFVPLVANRSSVTVVVRERSVDARKVEMRMGLSDLVGRHALMFCLARDLADFDVGTVDDGAGPRDVDESLHVSRSLLRRAPNSLRCESECLGDIVWLKVRIELHDLVWRHAVGDHLQDDGNRDPEPTDARDATHLIFGDRDPAEGHGRSLAWPRKAMLQRLTRRSGHSERTAIPVGRPARLRRSRFWRKRGNRGRLLPRVNLRYFDEAYSSDSLDNERRNAVRHIF